MGCGQGEPIVTCACWAGGVRPTCTGLWCPVDLGTRPRLRQAGPPRAPAAPHLDVGPHVLGVGHPLQEGDELEQLLVAVVVIPAGGAESVIYSFIGKRRGSYASRKAAAVPRPASIHARAGGRWRGAAAHVCVCAGGCCTKQSGRGRPGASPRLDGDAVVQLEAKGLGGVVHDDGVGQVAPQHCRQREGRGRRVAR